MAVATAKANLTKAISAVNKQIDEVETRLATWTSMSTSLLFEQREMVNKSRDILVAKIDRLREYQETFDQATLAAEEITEPTEEETKSIAEYIERSTTALDDATDVQDLLEAEIKRIQGAQLQPSTIATSSPRADTAENQASVQVRQLDLPSVPKFSGNRWEFENFWTLFEAVVGSSGQPPLLLFNHLVNALEGEALETVKRFQITADNYKLAVEALQEQYGGKTRTVAVLTKQLKEEVAKSENIADQRRLLDRVKIITTQLFQLGEPADSHLIQETIIDKFSRRIREKLYGRKLDLPEDEWTTTRIFKELDRIIYNDEQINVMMDRGPKKEDRKPSSDSRRADNRRSDSQNNKTKQCLACKREGHATHACRTHPNPEDRTRIIEKDGRCGQCLRQGHKTEECRGKPCFRCKLKGHSSSNCPSNDGQRNSNQPNGKSNKVSKEAASTPTQQAAKASSERTVVAVTANTTADESAATADRHSEGQADNPIDGRQGTIPTVRALGFNRRTGQWQPVSMMLDTGADQSYVSDEITRDWQLPDLGSRSFAIKTFSNEEPQKESFNRTEVRLRFGETAQITIHPYVTQQLVGRIGKSTMTSEDLRKVLRLQLDLNPDALEESVRPDIIIGQDFLTEIHTGTKTQLPSGLTLMGTIFGHTTMGRKRNRTPVNDTTDHRYLFSVVESTEVPDGSPRPMDWEQLVEQRQRQDMSMKSAMEFTGPLREECAEIDRQTIEFFKETVEKRDNGYYVRIPFKNPDDRHRDHFAIAKKRLQNLTRQHPQHVLQMMDVIFRDQLDKNILEIVDKSKDSRTLRINYNPHQPVLTPTKTTTKCRVVVDGGAHFKDSPSINDQIHQGPTILPDIPDLLVRFRAGKVAIISDVEKAFLQVHLHEEDRDITRVLWVKDISQPFDGDNIVVLRFTRVLFGLNVSPFLLAATINHHLESIDDHQLALDISTNLYVDNLLLTTDLPPELAVQIYTKTKQTFEDMSMNLREFLSNDSILNELIPDKDLSKDTSVKVLGITWNTENDALVLSVDIAPPDRNSRRTVSSIIAGVYDPMGFYAPLLLPLRLFQRVLWTDDYNWDTLLTDAHEEQWQDAIKTLGRFTRQIPRNVIEKSQQNILVTFTDASKEATACAIYVVNNLGSHLIFAKSKVKPCKETWTIPKLETQAIKMGVEKTEKVLKAMLDGRLDVRTAYIFTDSTIALQWINGFPGRKEVGVFVSNRLTSIKESANRIADIGVQLHFGHVCSEENPADLGTRGMDNSLSSCNLWWNGPGFLLESQESWRSRQRTFQLDNDEQQYVYSLVTDTVDGRQPVFDCNNTNNFTKMKRAVARALKFVKLTAKNLPEAKRTRMEDRIPELTDFDVTTPEIDTREVKAAERALIRDHQRRFTAKQMDSWSKLRPVKNTDGIIVCKGRLEKAVDIAEEAREPILVAPRTSLANQIIRHSHGPLHRITKHTVADVQERFWIPCLKQQVKAMKAKCIGCQRLEKLPVKYPDMGPLPQFRVRMARPFATTGVDYFGPIRYQQGDGSEGKAHGAIFTCTTTRATQIEVVPDNSTVAFIQAIRRFVAARGVPEQFISDNGPAFILGQDIINTAIKETELPQDVREFLSIKEIQWHFITPLSPWKGGFYERLVRIAKNAFAKANRLKLLSYEELTTVFYEVAAMMNCRPLTEPSDDVNAGLPIRPIDFIAPGMQVTLPLESMKDNEEEYLPAKDMQAAHTRRTTIDALQASVATSEKIWQQWRKEYLPELRQQHQLQMNKKRGSKFVPTIGQMVLIADDMVPRNYWRMGRVASLTSSSDGSIREVILDVASRSTGHKSELRRSINMIVPLEIDDDRISDSHREQTTSPHDEADQPAADSLPTEAQSAEVVEVEKSTKYNLRARKPVNYEEADITRTFFAGTMPTSATLITMLMLMVTVATAETTTGQVARKAVPVCSPQGLQINGQFESFEACVRSYCTTYTRLKWDTKHEYHVWIPQQLKLREHQATVKIFDGHKIETWELQCDAEPFCKTIDCTFCWINVLNPECNMTLAILGLGAFAFLGLLLLQAVCFSPIRIASIVHLGWTITKWIGKYSCRLCIAVFAKCRNQRARRNRWKSSIVILTLIISAPIIHGCQQVDVDSHFQTICSDDGNSEDCETATEISTELNQGHREACIRIERNGTTLRDIRIELDEVRFECTKETITFTKDVDIRVWSSKRCPSMGSCQDNKCADITPESLLPELQQVNDYVGNTRCTESCGGAGCGCFYLSSGCLFYRVYAVPRDETPIEVFRCMEFTPVVKLKMTTTTLNSWTNTAVRHELNMPMGQPTSIKDMTVTVGSLWTPPSPLLNTWFVRSDDHTATWDQGRMPALQCAPEGFNCTLIENCQCDAAEITMTCVCREEDIGFNKPERLLPVTEGHFRIERLHNNSVQAKVSSATLKVTVKIAKRWKTVTVLSKEHCTIKTSEARGCYACESGSSAEVSCFSEHQDTMANVECDNDEVFAIPCTTSGAKTNLTFFSDSARFHRRCSLRCGGKRAEQFEVSGILQFSGSLWTTLHHLINGNTTLYNEINLPDFEHIVTSYCTYMKTVVCTIAIVALVFMMTATAITRTGSKIVQLVVKGAITTILFPVKLAGRIAGRLVGRVAGRIWEFVKQRRQRTHQKTEHVA